MQEMTAANEIETGIKAMEVKVTGAIALIRDERSCDIASDIARECANWVDKIESELGPNREDAKRTYERLRDKIAGYKAPYIAWKAKISQAVSDWRLNERRRIEDENRKAIEKANQEAKAKSERAAAKLEKKGDPEAAAMVRADQPPIAIILQEAPKNKGVVDKTTWVVDLSPNRMEQWNLIQRIVAGGPVNMDLLMLNPSGLKKLAAIRHEEMKDWPGITVRAVFTSEIRRDSRTA